MLVIFAKEKISVFQRNKKKKKNSTKKKPKFETVKNDKKTKWKKLNCYLIKWKETLIIFAINFEFRIRN